MGLNRYDGISFTTLLVKLAVRTGHISSFSVLAVAIAMVAVSLVATAVMRGELATLPSQANMVALLWACATGLSLIIAVSSLFRALALRQDDRISRLANTRCGGTRLGVLRAIC
jgi:hypothetical protein